MATPTPTSADAPARGPRLSRNLALLYGGEGVAKALGLLSFGWLGHHLGAAAYGHLEFAIAVFFVLNLAMEAGLDPFGAREAAKAPSETNRLAGLITSLRLLVLVGSVLALWAIVELVVTSPERRAIMLLYVWVLLPAPFLLNWAFQARDRMGVVAASTLVRQLALFLGVVLFVGGPEDAARVPLAEAVGLGVVVLAQQWLFRRGGGRVRLFASREALGRVAQQALPLAGSTLVWALRVFAPTLALGLFATADETGVFGSAHRLSVALHTFAWLYFFNLLPSIARTTVAPNREPYRALMARSMDVVSWLVLPGCAGLGVAAPWLLPAVYGEGFEAAASVFQVQLGMVAAAFVSGHYRYSLIAFGRVRSELAANLAGTAVSVAACVALAQLGRLDPASAAVVFVVAEAVTLVVAHVLLARSETALSWLPFVGQPLLVLVIGTVAAWALVPELPLAGGALVVALGVAGLVVLRPNLARRLAASARNALGQSSPSQPNKSRS